MRLLSMPGRQSPQFHQPGLDHLQAVEKPQDLGVTAVGVLLMTDAVHPVPRLIHLLRLDV